MRPAWSDQRKRWIKALAPALMGAACSATPVAPATPATQPVAPEPALAPESREPAGLPPRPGEEPAPPPPAPAEPLPVPPPPANVAILSAKLAAIAGDRALERAVSSLIVVDVTSGAVLFERNADALLIPASNAKLLTTSAALGLLGSGHRMRTRVVAPLAPDEHGAVTELVLSGEHDFTWMEPFIAAPDAPLAELALAVRSRGVKAVTGTTWIAGEPVWNAARFEPFDPSSHRAAIAARFRQALTRAGVRVGAVRARAAFAPEEGAVLLAERLSPPLPEACAPINQLSHNGAADALLRHLGFVKERESSAAAGERATAGFLGTLGFPGAGVVLGDGSGLSRNSRVSSRILAQVLRHEAATPSFVGTLAVAGEKGTLAKRMTGPDTAGRVRGKTGSLAGVVATSGLVANRHHGRVLAFSFLHNEVREGALARRVHDAMITEIAGRWGAP